MFRNRLTRVLAMASAAVCVGLVVSAPAVGAATVPFTDPSAVGYLGFCDSAGHQVRSGSTGAAPFAVTAVSSLPAPPGYRANFGRGALYAFQPIKDVAPGDWSGKQLTAPAIFTNATYPMAAGTGRDPALVDFSSVFPLNWNGMVQVRMYFTAPDRPQHSAPYPATVLQVSGTTWTQLDGGSVPCDAGKATSIETIALPSSILNAPTARATPGATPKQAAPAGSVASGASNSIGPGSAAPNGGSNASPVAASTKSSGNDALIWTLIAVAVVAGGGAVFGWRRLHPKP